MRPVKTKSRTVPKAGGSGRSGAACFEIVLEHGIDGADDEALGGRLDGAVAQVRIEPPQILADHRLGNLRVAEKGKKLLDGRRDTAFGPVVADAVAVGEMPLQMLFGR